MYKPDYTGNSIVNLISSIKAVMGGTYSYAPLNDFDLPDINNKDIIFIVIDGLGYEFLVKYGRGSTLLKNLKKKITSVFPATTASAFTSLVTGVAPQQHALTGWFMYLKEIGAVTAILPFKTRAGNLSLKNSNIEFKVICKEESIFSDLRAKSFFVLRKDYADSQYSRLMSKGAKKMVFSNMNGFFRQINKALNLRGNKKFIFAYWDNLDEICHKRGTSSKKAQKHFDDLDKKITLLTMSLEKKNTVIIITADHGLIDTREKEKIIELKDHPVLADTLATPLCGDPRVVHCYVRPDKIGYFEQYTTKTLDKYCEMYRGEDLIKEGFFGLFEPNDKLCERVGDYILIMKDNYIMRDTVPGEKPNRNIGNHGGTSREEMFVPLMIS
jgi:hypothetical protein